MKDPVLLGLAAKAAGETGTIAKRMHAGDREYVLERENGTFWAPHLDDGDALRLAVKLCLCITFIADSDSVEVYQKNENAKPFNVQTGLLDDYGTRIAIFLAAAEIGKTI